VAKQLDKIGLHLSTTLVNAGLTTFQKILDTGPREIELVGFNWYSKLCMTTPSYVCMYLFGVPKIMNRHPPFGNQIKDAISLLPRYKLEISQVMNQ